MTGYRISIIRHGMTEANEKGIYIGKTDMPLSAKGASELASKMDEFDYPTVYRGVFLSAEKMYRNRRYTFPETELVKVDGLRELDLGILKTKALTNS